MKTDKDLMTTDELVDFLGVNKTDLYKEMKKENGSIPFIKKGREFFYSKQAILDSFSLHGGKDNS